VILENQCENGFRTYGHIIIGKLLGQMLNGGQLVVITIINHETLLYQLKNMSQNMDMQKIGPSHGLNPRSRHNKVSTLQSSLPCLTE